MSGCFLILKKNVTFYLNFQIIEKSVVWLHSQTLCQYCQHLVKLADSRRGREEAVDCQQYNFLSNLTYTLQTQLSWLTALSRLGRSTSSTASTMLLVVTMQALTGWLLFFSMQWTLASFLLISDWNILRCVTPFPSLTFKKLRHQDPLVCYCASVCQSEHIYFVYSLHLFYLLLLVGLFMSYSNHLFEAFVLYFSSVGFSSATL